jgi:hypothetical protein
MKKTWMQAFAAVVASLSLEAMAACQNVSGLVMQVPEDPGTCTVKTYYPDPAPIFVGNVAGAPPTCFFDIIIAGGPLFGAVGYSGVTVEGAASPLVPDVVLPTPLAIHQQGVTTPRQFFTARSAIVLRSGAVLRTADAGVFEDVARVDPLAAAEHLVLTDGTGAYRGATGRVIIAGSSVGALVPFRGQICMP